MEEKIYVEKFYRLTCVDCATVREYPNKDAAQAYGWAISRDGKKCYCPACACKHRVVGWQDLKQSKTGEQLDIGGLQGVESA